MNSSGLSANDFLTLAVALYGAIIATILGIFQIKQYRREIQHRIVFFCDTTPLMEEDPSKREDIIKIRAVNDGQRTLEIMEMGFLQKGKLSLSTSFDIPKKLEPGISITACFLNETLFNKIDDITEYYAKDAAGNWHISPVSSFTKDQIRALTVLNSSLNLIDTAAQSNLAVNQILKDHDREMAQLLEEMRIWADQFAREQKEFEAYRLQQGKLHPDREKQIAEILDEDAKRKREQEFADFDQRWAAWCKAEEEWEIEFAERTKVFQEALQNAKSTGLP